MRVQRVSDPDERRFEIIAAARQLFREKGLRRTTYSDIAQAVGVTRGLVYHYFPTRDDLLDAAVTEFTAEIVDAVAKWDASRQKGHVREALDSAVALLRRLVHSNDPFAEDLSQVDNARAYAILLDQVVEAVVNELESSTVRDYAAEHGVQIAHIHETFLVLLYGLISLLRAKPDVSNDVLFDIAWNTLHLEEPGDDDWPGKDTPPPATPTISTTGHANAAKER